MNDAMNNPLQTNKLDGSRKRRQLRLAMRALTLSLVLLLCLYIWLGR
jgi:hypothetical protein